VTVCGGRDRESVCVGVRERERERERERDHSTTNKQVIILFRHKVLRKKDMNETKV
jgi:hypothetical protein